MVGLNGLNGNWKIEWRCERVNVLYHWNNYIIVAFG